MRRIVSGPVSLFATVLGLSFFPIVASAAPDEDEPIEIVDDEEDLVILDGEEDPGDDAPAASIFGEDDAIESEFVSDEEIGVEDEDSKEKQIQADTKLISVIQRQRMLKKGRFEIQPQVGISINDPYVRHYTIGLDLNYWITNRMAIGVTGTAQIGATTPRYRNIRFQQGLLLTANENLWQASVNYTYNPFYGKIAIFNRALLHWEWGLQIGGGAMQTRIIPRYPPLHEPFSTVTGGGQFGLISRFYLPNVDWLALNMGVRTWIFADLIEPGARGPNTDPNRGGQDRVELNSASAAKDAARDEGYTVGYNVVFYIGASFFIPSSFKYSTPR